MKLTVDIGTRGRRGILGERIGNIVISTIGIVVRLFRVIMILEKSDSSKYGCTGDLPWTVLSTAR